MAPPQRLADSAASGELILVLPHPYQTPSRVEKGDDAGFFRLRPAVDADASNDNSRSTNEPLPRPLHSASLYFTEPADPKSSDRPDESNNTAWGRARRSPAVAVRWDEGKIMTPTIGHLWLLTYVILTLRPREEAFRLTLSGRGTATLARQLQTVGLAVPHPAADAAAQKEAVAAAAAKAPDELLVLRGAFWQGAGSPFGPRPVWAPELQDPDLAGYPLPPSSHTLGGGCWHPRRRAKPRPGSVIYSRWIPHLRETFSMVALDCDDEEHVALFHAWQNDPRVSQGWHQAGTRAQHAAYLRRAHNDPHQLPILARFDGTCFAYFETYWAKEDAVGAYYAAGDHDRGRHSLVGDVRYRGPHRVSAWWSSLVHYLFLDDPRTAAVVGEPKCTNSPVLMYDLMHGFGLDKLVDLPYKRSALVRCSRERFFQLCPLDENDKVMGGTGVGLVPKL